MKWLIFFAPVFCSVRAVFVIWRPSINLRPLWKKNLLLVAVFLALRITALAQLKVNTEAEKAKFARRNFEFSLSHGNNARQTQNAALPPSSLKKTRGRKIDIRLTEIRRSGNSLPG